MFILFTTEQIHEKIKRTDLLISAIGKGEREAMGELYQLIKTDIFAYALAKVGNKADAEDVTHDAFVNIYKYAPLYKSCGKPMAWVYTIALNLSKRQRTVKSRHVSYDDSIGDSAESGECFEDGAIKNDYVRTLMKVLGEREREIVVMHAVSGLKHREIAELLNMPLSTVLSIYNRSIKKLQAAAKEETL